MMRLSHFSALLKTLRNAPALFSHYSTAATKSHGKFGQDSLNGLYGRIARSGYNASLIPILDGWIRQRQTIDRFHLVTLIRELRHNKNYARALEVSMWMSDNYVRVSPSDVVIRLDLIARVHGIEEAENYFNNIPNQGELVYHGLLNCYANANHLEKAEATMQKMRDLGFSKMLGSYNLMLNLYYKTGNKEKFDSLMSEMEENGIGSDKFTYGIRLSAAAAASDLKGIDKIQAEWESDPRSLLNWAVAANAYTKAGAVDKAFAMLKRAEEQIPSSKRPREAYNRLMTQYAGLGKKDDTLRLWKCYKEHMKINNKGYSCILNSLLKLDDIESAEKIFEEWESEHVMYDPRVPNSLIGAYTRKGFLDKAEAIMSRIALLNQQPNLTAWNYLAKGYLDHGQFEKAVESATKGVFAAQPGWTPNKDVVVGCLEYFKVKADLEGAEKFIKLFRDKNMICVNMQERLLNHIKGMTIQLTL